MGVMIEGTYHADDPGPDTTQGGAFRRAASTIRNWITPDGAPGATGRGGFTPDAGRYHLYAAWNCPWAHRVVLTRALLDLGDEISIAFARPRRTDQGWVYDPDGPFSDPELGINALHEVFAIEAPAYTGRLTVPVLWDRETRSIVSNESADIVRMLGTTWDPDRRLCPPDQIAAIDRWNALIYPTLNNGVYRAGFARTQEAYEAGARDVFETLDTIEAQLRDTPFLTGDTVTEADIRLFPTLARFDVAYHYAFRCNLHRITDYPELWDYARAIYQMPGVADTVRFEIYKQGYFSPSEARNPLGIVPIGPDVDWSAPSGRTARLS